ncbi:MAG TPA: 16S rRNA (guanine(527)-N(7))-methyltransferase RsmG [Anaeromyxobacteraceae bacterium]|nr:16S rRNA (guanine(527)-N(7))-methyltransferase RsmG [Anaeromyxobacteraceae bacterium]
MDTTFDAALRQGIEALGLEVDAVGLTLLTRYADRLLAWNRKVNLTAVTAPVEVAEKHLVDSLALLRVLGPARSVLDLGSGAGLPGAALACARRDLSVVCADSVAKKVAFVKAVSAELALPVRGVVVRAAGAPDAEGLPRSAFVVSRALADPDRWVPLGAAYLAEGGVLAAMLGREAEESALREVGAAHGLELVGVDRFELPLSKSARAIATWRRAGP